MKKLMAKLERLLAAGGIKKDGALLALSGAAVICSLLGFRPFPFDMARIAIILCGVPIILEAVIGLVTAFDIKADVLVSLALIASICIGEDFAAGEVAFIMQLGGLLEELTVARAGIEKLMHLTPQTARVLHGEGEEIIPAEQVRVGDRIRVLPGEGVPVDGVIVSGQTSINQAVMTGESLPVDKTVGDSVSSGTVNQLGTFEMETTKVGEDSSIQRMIRLVQSADAGKAKLVGVADRWATWIVIIALNAAALTWIFTGQIIRAVTSLVVFCPCALVHNAGSVLVIVNSAFLLKWRNNGDSNHWSGNWRAGFRGRALLSCQRKEGSRIQENLWNGQRRGRCNCSDLRAAADFLNGGRYKNNAGEPFFGGQRTVPPAPPPRKPIG